jgi:alpha-methylacyl-CoA racemase
VAIGCLEPRFFAELVERLGLAGEELPDQYDRDGWPRLRKRLAETFLTRTRAEWCSLLEGTAACFAPVLGLGEAPDHPHNRARAVFTEVDGVVHPAPAPRLSRTPGAIGGPAPRPGQHTASALADWGVSAGEISRLLAGGVLRQDEPEG